MNDVVTPLKQNQFSITCPELPVLGALLYSFNIVYTENEIHLQIPQPLTDTLSEELIVLCSRDQPTITLNFIDPDGTVHPKQQFIGCQISHYSLAFDYTSSEPAIHVIELIYNMCIM